MADQKLIRDTKTKKLGRCEKNEVELLVELSETNPERGLPEAHRMISPGMLTPIEAMGA